jgi:hypothetical protein
MIRTLAASFGLAVATILVAAAAASPTVQPGDQSRWSLDFRASMEQSTARPIEIHMSGAWTSTISAVRANDYDAQLQLAKIQFSGDALKSTSAAGLKDLQTRLSRPFWATYRNDGGLLSVHFYRDMSASDRNLLQMIATELQLVQPGSARQSWTAQERDGAGEYAALYLMSQPDRIVKHKIKYIYTDGMAGAPVNAMQISIDQSDVAFSLTPDHRLQSADGVDRVRMSLPGDKSQDKSQQLTAVTEFHATDLQTGAAPELAGGLAREHANVVDLPIVTQGSDSSVVRAEADDRLLKDLTTDAILGAAFSDAAFSKNPGTVASPDRLTALFRSRPDAAANALALLIKNGPNKTVTNALGAAGSLSASASLSELAHNASLPQDLRVDALLAFIQLQHPAPEIMRVPSDLLNDSNPALKSAARLISGALAHAGRPEHPAEADAIDGSLVALYRNAREVGEKTELLGALGNSAGPIAAQAADEALNDASAPIRAAATRALRLVLGDDIDRRLAVVMLNDSDPAVRADAIFATRFRHPLSAALADALMKVAGADQVIYVRSDALAILRQNPNASPRIQQTLAHIAESDPDTGIRSQAKDALAAMSAQASTRP